MPNDDTWHAFGHFFTPKTTWSKVVNAPGLRSLTIEGKSQDSDATQAQVKIEPSLQVRPGIAILINQHYDQDKEATPAHSMLRFRETTQKKWEGFLKYAEFVAFELFNEFERQ